MAFDYENAETIRALISESGLTLRMGPQPSAQASTSARLGRYPVTGHLGAGGMGEVLQVRDEDVGREMAAKVILGEADQKSLSKFIREGQITGQLEHPNIVPLYELGMTPDKRVYFTMKRVDGQDLSALLNAERVASGALRSGRVARVSSRRVAVDLGGVRRKSLMRFLNIFLKICDAIGFAHSRGVIHRDLKPANIMVGQFGEVQVMDWGLAKVIGQADPLAEGAALDLGGGRVAGGQQGPLKTVDGAVVGTPAYMPPEQARGEVESLDRRSDVYALGAMLYEILTLELPYEGETLWDVLVLVRKGNPLRPSERAPGRSIPWELEAVVTRAMPVEPKDRYHSVEQLKADIESYLEGRTLAAVSYTSIQLLSKWVKRHRYICGAAAAVLLVSLGLLGWVRWQARQLVEGQLHRAQAAQQRQAFDEAITEFGRVLAALPAHAQARDGIEASFLSLAREKLANSPGAEVLRARWQDRDRALRGGTAERPEEPEARERRETILRDYLAGVATLDRGLGRLPESHKLRRLRREAGEALGWIALLGRDYSLAGQAFEQLARAGLSAKRVTALVGHVRLDRERRLELWKSRVRLIVADIRQGLHRRARARGAAKLEDHLIEVSAYRHPAIVAQLGGILRAHVIRVAPRRGPKKIPWSQAERDLAIFICQVSGRLGLRESVTLLAEWMAVVVDDRLAAEAGIALCNTRRAQAHAPLLAAWKRLGLNSAAWAQIEPFFARVPAPRKSGQSLGTAIDHNTRGLVRQAKGDLEGAIAEYDRAISLDRRYAMAYGNRGNAKQDKGDLAGAMADYDRALWINPRFAQVYTNRGNLRTTLGDHEGAISDFDRAIALFPRDVNAHIGRGNTRKLQGDLAGAISDFDRAIKIDPRHVGAYINRGTARLARRDIGGAMADYDRAIAIDPRSASAHLNRGNARRARGDLAGAVSDYDQAIQLDPRRANAFNNRGVIRMAQGDRAGAISDYDRAIAIDGKQPSMFLNRGNARQASGNADGALADYTQALKLRPKFYPARWIRGILLAHLGRRSNALSDLRAAARMKPSDAYAALWVAGVERPLSKEGRAGLERCASGRGWGTELVRCYLGRLSAKDLLGIARRAPRPAAQRERLCEAYAYLGLLSEQSGKLAQAKQYYGACLATGVSGFVEFGWAQMRLKKFQKQ